MLTWQIYPRFGNALRVDERVITLDEYVETACGERVGPLATSCHAEAAETGSKLVAREQAKSILLIELPAIGYTLATVLRRLVTRRNGVRRQTTV